ncbi:MAG: hypothetical protein QOH46_227 [Solirubrobacteraceae bacterium]|nr:hypothetical protein [Solirubrobacteraceae bacterium]
MNVLRLRDMFVAAPAVGSPAELAMPALPSHLEAHARGPAGDLAIVCAAEDARAVGVAAAALLARRHRAACGLACVWTATGTARPDARPLATGATRRLAAALAARGLDSTACGRAVAVALPGDPPDALSTTRRALAAAGAAPTIVVLGGPRDAALDALLADQGRVVVLTRGVRGADDPLTALALAGLSDVADVSVAEPIVLGAATRAAAAAGVAIPRALRRALSAALERLDEQGEIARGASRARA